MVIEQMAAFCSDRVGGLKLRVLSGREDCGEAA